MKAMCTAIGLALATFHSQSRANEYLGNDSTVDWRNDMLVQAYQDLTTVRQDAGLDGSSKKYTVYCWTRSRFEGCNIRLTGGTAGAIVGLESVDGQGAYSIRLDADEERGSIITLNSDHSYGVYLSNAGFPGEESLVRNTQINCNGQGMTGMHISGSNRTGGGYATPNRLLVDQLEINMNGSDPTGVGGRAIRACRGGVITNRRQDGSIAGLVQINLNGASDAVALSAVDGGCIELSRTTIQAGSAASSSLILAQSAQGASNTISLTDCTIMSKTGNTLIRSDKAVSGTQGSHSLVTFHALDLSQARDQLVVAGDGSRLELTLSGGTAWHGWSLAEQSGRIDLVLEDASWMITRESFLGTNGSFQTKGASRLEFAFAEGSFSRIHAASIELDALTELILDVDFSFFSSASLEYPVDIELFRTDNPELFAEGNGVTLMTRDLVMLSYTRADGVYYVHGPLAIAIPEPATGWMAIAALGFSSFLRNRRGRAQPSPTYREGQAALRANS